jgi:hypothetical protein
MNHLISGEGLISVLRVLRQDPELRGRLAREHDSGPLIEEVAQKAGVKLDSKSLMSEFYDYDVSDQELEDISPHAGTKKCNFQCGNLFTIGK